MWKLPFVIWWVAIALRGIYFVLVVIFVILRFVPCLYWRANRDHNF